MVLGSGASLLTYLAGRAIEADFAGPVVELHSRFAVTTIVTYGVLAASYLIAWIKRDFYETTKKIGLWLRVTELNQRIFVSPVVVILSFVGLILITITGALGGILAFGPDTDPMTQIANQLFFGK